MPVKPPLYSQETDFSCAPACLRMVLAAAGIEKSEEELREASNCDFTGTSPHEIVKVASSFGFEKSRTFNLNFDNLKSILAEGVYPIAFINTRIGTTGRPQKHAVVVVEIKEYTVVLFDPDPKRGEIEISVEVFLQEWGATRRETTLIR
jgi:ABC-type bacteriocin/lantibiotic exporter with double-glycine peptidase domain